MHWTHSEIIELLKAATPFVVALNMIIGSIAAWQAKRAKDHAVEAVTKVEEVHACLHEARVETLNGIEEVKTQATAVAEAVMGREGGK